MKNSKLILFSLASDLNRITNSIQRGSYATADRFSQEASQWLKQLSKTKQKPYVRQILNNLENDLLKANNSLLKAEESLMYSTLLQNYAMSLEV
ncbi:hypothetical protein KKD62_00815 [Patescibacteria group bacterium]|nr:hypothetical protein [Patescibacteria group bacterium]MBU1931476.1 hypothetical protein [Patescibacteria group bacterium]